MKTFVAIISLLLCGSIAAQSNADIIDDISSSGNIIIVQPPALRQLLKKDSTTVNITEGIDNQATRNHATGYRIQVFSDNNATTAKNEARTKSRLISAHFPQYRTYVTYTSPYWRLRVGDFRTEGEAEAAADEIKSAFPSYAKEIRIVRDKISLNR